MERLRTAARQRIIGSPLEPVARRLRRLVRRQPADHGSARYDDLTLQVMARVLGRGSCCVDVGAHRGDLLGPMLALAPEGDHYAFEPVPGLAERLRDEFPTVQVLQMALADFTGRASFRHVLGDAEYYSGFSRRPYDTYEERVELIDVEVRRLDDVLPQGYPLRFLKVDVEGAEVQLFRGAMGTLGSQLPYVAFESGADHEATFDLLHEAGLRLSLLDGWLHGQPPLTRPQFLNELRSEREYFFLAHPPRDTSQSKQP